jgi:DNA-binding MarR family transcriptional regulator
VVLLDELEQRGLIERRDNPADRRSYALHLTRAGLQSWEEIARIRREYHNALCAALDESERAQLIGFLTRIAAQQQLTPGVHPGFRRLGGAQPKSP